MLATSTWLSPTNLAGLKITSIIFLTYLLTYLLTYSTEQSPSWEANWFLQLIKKFPAFYGTRKFITVLTTARHLSVSWANSIHSPQPLPTSWRSILILSSHLRLGLPNGLFPSGFPTKPLCTPLPSSIRAVSYFLRTLSSRGKKHMEQAKK